MTETNNTIISKFNYSVILTTKGNPYIIAAYFLPNLLTAYPQNGVAMSPPTFVRLPSNDTSIVDMGADSTVAFDWNISKV